MMLDTAIFTLKTDRPVEESAEKLRGYFGTRFPEHPLLHQHVDGGYLYTYPKIQYKIIEGTPYILGIEEGVKVLKEISDAIKKIELNGYTYKVAGQINYQEIELIASRNEYKYRFLTPWLPLNKENYEAFKEIYAWRDRKKFLNNILEGNIISMCKGLGIIVNPNLYVHSHLDKNISEFKGIPLTSYMGEFIVNFKIPDFFGIGQKVSHGYGTVKNVKINE